MPTMSLVGREAKVVFGAPATRTNPRCATLPEYQFFRMDFAAPQTGGAVNYQFTKKDRFWARLFADTRQSRRNPRHINAPRYLDYTIS
jgi:hypothetical protein